MNSSRFRPEVYYRLIHPLMSISVSSTGVLAVIWLIAVNAGIAAPRVGTIVAVIVASLLEAVVGNILFRERAGIANRARELILYLVFLYLVFSIVRPGPLTDRFLPSTDQFLPIIGAAITWFIAFGFHDRLRGRESLLRAFHGHHGAELRRAVLERQHDMALTVGQMRKARGLMGGLFVVLVLLTLFASLDFLEVSVLRPGSGAFVMLVLYGMSAIVAIGSLNTFIQEYAANGEGLAVPLRFQRRRSLVAVAVLLLVVVLAFALSRNESILPLEAIGDFFRWLASLFDREGAMTFAPPAPPPAARDVSPDMLEMLQGLEPKVPPLWLRILARLMERVAITALIVGGVILLFGPIFSPAFRRALREIRPGTFLKQLWESLRKRVKIVGRLLKAGLRRRRRRSESAAAVPEASSEAWRANQWKPGLRKRRQMDRVVQVFVDVTRWGEKRGVRYTRSEAAKEYLTRVAVVRPERFVDTQVVAETFCEAKFSRHLVPRTQMRAYAQAARRITTSE